MQSLGVLAAGIAHEINNPLAFIRGNLDHLTRLAGLVSKQLDAYAPADAEALAEMADVIDETLAGVDRIAGIVGATRRLARDPMPVFTTVDLNEVAESALQLAALHANREVEVEWVPAPDAATVRGSAETLGQVVLNLLVNAKQAAATGASGRIRLALAHGATDVSLHVDDDGPGVPVELRECIFDPFFTTKAPAEGTGLGLAIAAEISDQHGGALSCGDSPLGGARFTLRLPGVGRGPVPGA
jgi:two-component system NtrC family sensor kinase